jgi:hypothetical protein
MRPRRRCDLIGSCATGGKALFGTGAQPRCSRAGDVLVIEADPRGAGERAREQGLKPRNRQRRPGAVGDGVRWSRRWCPKARASPGKTAGVGLAWRQNTTLMGIARQGRTRDHSCARRWSGPGDILLLLLPADRGADVVAWLGGMPLADRASPSRRRPRPGPPSPFRGRGRWRPAWAR